MKYLISTLILILIISHFGFAQDSLKTGRIDGRVVDKETQQPIAGATIRLINKKLGAIADSKGNFTVKNIPIGRYSVSAHILGYSTQVLTDIIVVTKRTAIANFELVPEAVQTGEIIVKPDYFPSEPDAGNISFSKIANNELRMTPGMPDLFKRLQFMPGISRSSESSSVLIVRGGDPEENLTLVENIEIASPFHFSSMNGNLVNGSTSIIEPKLVESVNLSAGGFSAMYGDKLSSISQITIKEPEKNNFNADISLDLAGLSAFISSPISNNLSFTLAGRRGVLDLMLDMMGEDFTSRTSDFHTKILYEPSQNHKISFYALYAEDQIKGSQEDDFGEDRIYTNLNKDQYSIGINWKWLFADNGYMVFTPYKNTTNWNMNHGANDNRDAFIDKNNESTTGIKADVYYKITNNQKISLGFDVKTINAEYYKQADPDTLANGNIIEAFSLNYQSKNAQKTAIFAEYNITPTSWANLNFGVRHDYFDYINKSVINPRISAGFKLSDASNLNLAVGQFSQFPQFYRIFMDETNKSLQPSEAIHYIAAVDYMFGEDSQIKFEAFLKSFNKLPVQLNDTSKLYQSTGRGRSYGIELSYVKQMSDNFYLLCNYTYSVSERKDTVGDTFYNFKFDRPHSANVMLTYRLGDWWEFGLTAAYSSGSPYTPLDLTTRRQVDGVWYCNEGKRNSARFTDYFRIDFRAERRFVFDSWNFRAYLDLWNITNHENIFEYTWNKDFTRKKGSTLYPFMPIIGLAAEL